MRKLLTTFVCVWFTLAVWAGDGIYEKLQQIPQISEIQKLDVKPFQEYYQFWFEQPVDHSDPAKGTFRQRVLLGHKQSDAPVIVELEGYNIWSSEEGELANILKGNQLTIEHRFFDQSVPEGGIPWENLTIKQAMSELVKQAGENDNIMTIYVVDEKGVFAGAIDLKDLIRARENAHLEDLVLKSYPYVTDHEKIDDCIDTIKDYAEDSIPVLSKDKHILGVITSDDIVEMVDNEMGEDYAKLAGLTAEEDLKETTLQSMKKRMPWLIILLFLGMIVSSVVGIFENVVAALPIVICFQSLVLDMAGNVGTQSLAVTIRVLMDENLSGKQKLLLVVKEVRIGLVNGGLLGIMALVFLGIYVHLFKGYTWLGAFAVSGCVGVSLLVAMAISSLVGTVIPMFFHKIKIDPAVASGPLITTVNDLVAVVTYYGLAFLFLIEL